MLGFQSVTEGQRYANTRQLLSSFIKRTMLKISAIEDQFSLQINDNISVWLMLPWTLNGVIYGIEFPSYIII